MSAGADSSLINALLEAGTLDQTALPRAYHTPGRQATRDAEGDTETAPATAREEEALEWHEVIELQAFSERKAWIEEKIKFLEKLPPIQVFVGLDAVRTSAEEVPGLPSREQLQQWLAEHDKIEKETEGFDSGELKKLKKFTKAATQRNLSPADTDLIELTLTTIYELDKLLHLLRDRSDNLELLSLRLTWEERRTSAWVELRSIVEDLQNFLQTRGRWSPAVYDNFVEEDEEQDIEDSRTISPPIVKRKGSTVSLASSTSDSYSSSLILSRGERYKLAERLSRDAAQFASRVSSLKHSKINAAGKALDRLIDESRAPVPDELLDEQDKLEDKGIKEMEDIGKFVMSIVMQWKRADEMYAETVKDKSYAQTLLEEIEIALLHHPTSRQDSSFLARSTALTKRLEMRRDPSGTSNAFPRPRHPIFDDQRESNDHIAEVLASELLSALDCARKVEVAMKEYHVNFEAVKKVEALCTVISDLYNRFESLTTQLEMGIENAAGDGNPPDLQNEHCLEPTSHHAFLSMVENILQELGRANEDADKLLQQARAALLDLKHPSIDAKFKADAADAVEMLEIRRRSALRSRDLITTRVAALHQLRGIWSNMARILDDLDNIRCDVAALTDVQMWKQQTQQNAALLTPESPTCPLPSSDLSPTVALEQLDALELRLHQMVLSPFATLSDSIGDDLQGYINNCCSGLSSNLEDARRMTRFWKSVQKQASEMEYVRDGTYALQLRVEDLKTQFDGSIRDALQGEASGCITPELDASLHDNLKQIQRDVQTYLDELPTRVSFVSQENSATSSSPPRLKRRFSVSAGLSLEAIQEAMFTAPSINPVELDRAVRADSNSYSMSLSGGLESLSKKADLYRLAQVACKIDASLVAPQHNLHQAEQALKSLQHVLEEQGDSLENLTLLSEQCDAVLAVHEPSIASVLTSARDLFECLHIGSTSHDPTSVASMLYPRRRAIEDVEEQFRAWKEDVEVFSERISDMQHLVQVKLAEKRIKDEEEKIGCCCKGGSSASRGGGQGR
ncbi:hypothetical protein EW026_g2127 [Hermanssonia centrifuga]|uniref:Uncharacterized protein n=1 Tax=Hermanssonia centrifuga TaxID=98765 RepID=A0A4S4KR63_9APHY|nr:hypothetical protein EW026_g2127 [Hermanssonia centrifuga]